MSAIVPVSDIEKMAGAVARSNLFGIKTPDQAMALMLIAQAEGLHPAIAARDYHVIQGKPSLKADAMLARFQTAGGKVQWDDYTDTKVSGTFSHAQGGSVKIEWTIDMAKRAGLSNKDNWKNYPRAQLRARCISEGIRTVFPGGAVGIYTPEEVQDFDDKTLVDITPTEGGTEERASAKPLFKNASLRNTWCKGVIEQMEKAPTKEEILAVLNQWKAKCDELIANGHEHDVLAVDSIRMQADIILKRFKSPPREGSVADLNALQGMPPEHDEWDDEPASYKATALPEGEVMPGFIARGRNG